jgi:hypothetical protein
MLKLEVKTRLPEEQVKQRLKVFSARVDCLHEGASGREASDISFWPG